jgi:hypothetical protein
VSQEFIVYLFLAFVVGAVTAYLICKVRFEQLRAQLVEARTQLAERTASYEREQELSQKNALTVLMYPYKKEHGEDGYFSDERRVEIGYLYQLFVAGVPCFEPHRIPVEVLSKKEVNIERIEQAMQTAFALIETFAGKHPAFAAVKSAPVVIDHVRKVAGKKDA